MILDPHGFAGKPLKLMRQSIIGQWSVCPERVNLDRHHGGGWSEPRIVGTGYHAGLAQLYEHQHADPFPDHDAIALAIEEAFMAEVALAKEAGCVVTWDKFGSMSMALQGAQLMAKYYVQSHRLPSEHFDVIGVEVPFWYPIGDEWVAHGTIDLVLEDKRDGTHWLRDHKTAGRPWKKGKESARANVQPGWYLAFWPMLWSLVTGGEAPITRFAFDVMTYDLKFETRIADRNRAQMQRVFDVATQVAVALDDEAHIFVKNTDHYLCDERWCDHWNRCSFGAGFNNDPTPMRIPTRRPA